MQRYSSLQKHAWAMLGLCGIQFIFGMIANLYVTVPASHPGVGSGNFFAGAMKGLGWALSSSGWDLASHAGTALLIIIGCLALAIRGGVLHSRRWLAVGVISTLFALGAFFNGLAFINYNHDFSSLIMALCWLVVVISLVVGIAVPVRRKRSSKV